jgi:hypothetical protein
MFQSDLFPKTAGPDATMTCEEWMSGKTAGPILINLEETFVPCQPKEFITSGQVSRNPSVSQSIIVDLESLQKEITDLKLLMANKDARIRQLEAQLVKE